MFISLTWSKGMQELLLLCFFVADVTWCAVECTKSSCMFENFACLHISTEEKWIMHFSYMSYWLYKSVRAYWYKYKHVFWLSHHCAQCFVSV